MTRLLPLLMLMLPLGHAWGQVYFDSIYDVGHLTDRSSNALPSPEGGYEFFTTGVDFISGGGSVLSRHLTDGYGHTMALDTWHEDSSRFEIGSISRTLDGGTICHYSRMDQGTGFNPELRRYSSSGELVWASIYGDSVRTHASMEVRALTDSGFVCIGQVYDDTDGDMKVFRTDRWGGILWERVFGGTHYDCGNSVTPTLDSGFLLLGWTRSYGAGQRDWYLVKTDSLGNQEWQKTYGDANNQSGSCIVACHDGDYVMCGGAGNGAARMIKITAAGTVIWQHDYSCPESTDGNYLYKLTELGDGSLVATGSTINSAESNAGWLLKTDSEGNELWQRKYNKNESLDFFYSVLQTVDKGFLLSGQAINLETNNQDAWLLKVDSVGCPYPNCTVGVDEVKKSKVVVDVWPNPANEVLNVQWHTAHPSTPLRVTFTDMLGRSYSPPAQEVQGVVGPYMQYDVSTFENGLYLLTIIQNSVRTTLKVVVEH